MAVNNLDFPEVSKQQQSEISSLSILRQKLDGIFIIRDQRESDFGIDAEFELLEDRVVDGVSKKYATGHLVKIQVKGDQSMTTVYANPKVYNIKQSTLVYWAEMAYNIPVIALGVDTTNSNIYSTGNIFWQATKLITPDGSNTHITFINNHDIDNIIQNTKSLVNGYSNTEVITAHKWFLKNVNAIFEFYADVSTRDLDLTLDSEEDTSMIDDLLRNSKIIMYGTELIDILLNQCFNTKIPFDLFFSEEFVRDQNALEPTNRTISLFIETLALPLSLRVHQISKEVRTGAYYWLNKDPQYYYDVVTTAWPKCENIKSEIKHMTLFTGENEFREYDNISKEIETKSKEYCIPTENLWELLYKKVRRIRY